MNTYDTIIIGAGQAGLAIGYYLKRSANNFLIIDSTSQIGDSWRNRYDSLKLFTPRSHSVLPGLSMVGDPNGYPTKDEIADYLKLYQERFCLPILLNDEVIEVFKKKCMYKITTRSKEVFYSKNIVIAVGAFQYPVIPSFGKQFNSSIYQIHTNEYKNSSQLKDGNVLIVGGGNSGVQIAVELAKENRVVYLSVGKKPRFLPYSLLGKSIFWWFSKLGIMNFPVNSLVGNKIRMNDPIVGNEIKSLLKSQVISIFPRSIDVKEDTIYFEDKTSIQPKNVIWATGFKNEYGFLESQMNRIFDGRGYPIHNRGVTDEEGLYFIGLAWQYKRGSALLLGVGEDAELN